MQIQRPAKRSTNRGVIGCGIGLIGLMGCLIVSGVGLLLFWPVIAGVGLQAVGFAPQGDINTVLEQAAPAPTVVVQNPVSPPQAVVNLGSYGTQTLDTASTANVVIGSSESGAPVAVVSYTEAQLMALCVQRSPECANGNDQFRNTRIDLRPGGAVIYADVNLGGMWQTVGGVLQFDAASRRLDVAGVELGGLVYSAPPSSEITSLISRFETTANDLIQQLSLQAGGAQYRLDTIQFDEAQVMFVLR